MKCLIATSDGDATCSRRLLVQCRTTPCRLFFLFWNLTRHQENLTSRSRRGPQYLCYLRVQGAWFAEQHLSCLFSTYPPWDTHLFLKTSLSWSNQDGLVINMHLKKRKQVWRVKILPSHSGGTCLDFPLGWREILGMFTSLPQPLKINARTIFSNSHDRFL
jgi:hypothetical protein